MALDFVVDLVLPEFKDAVFNRGSLELTCKLINFHEPEITQAIQSILANKPICSTQFKAHNIHQDNFYVSLNARQVRAIIEVLSDVINEPEDVKILGKRVLAKSLLEEWMKLATAMMLELNKDN